MMTQLTISRMLFGLTLFFVTICSSVLLTVENAGAAVDYVRLTGSHEDSNQGRQYSLKNYTVNFSRNHPSTGAVINPGGYSNASSECSRAHATLPWLATSDQPKSDDVPIDSPVYDGNSLDELGSCHNRYTDGGVNSNAWLPPSYLNWTLPGSVPGFGPVYSNSSITAACSDETKMRGGVAPLISRLEIIPGDHSLKFDQAYGTGGIFSTFWGATPPSGPANGVRLYSYGTGLIRNQFTLTSAEYDYVENGNVIKLYAMGDDWIRMYVNGTQVGTTNISGQVIETEDVRHLLNPGTNIIAIQVHDKSMWRTNNRAESTTGVCYNLSVTVPQETQVSANVSLAGSGLTLPGQSVDAEARIDNLGGRSGQVNWQRVLYYSSADTALHTGPYLRQQSGTNTTIPVSGLDMVDWPQVVDASSGYICTRLSIQSSSSDTVVSVAMDHECLPIGKHPQVQISGGDIAVRSRNSEVRTLVNTIDGRNYGSWVEYSIFAAGPVQSVSGAALPAMGYGSGSFDRTQLTFANDGTPAGNFASGSNLPFGGVMDVNNGVWQDWTTNSINHRTTITPSNLANNQINSKTNGSLVIDGGAWGNFNRSTVVYSSGNITINESIRYVTESHNSVDDLPQLVLIARGNILIDEDVSNVDAWLIAGGTINSCRTTAAVASPYYAGLSNDVCDSRLRVNGPIQADRLQLRRTAGADGAGPLQRSRPAEVLNFRSDALLWAYGKSSATESIKTDTVRDLPPRF